MKQYNKVAILFLLFFPVTIPLTIWFVLGHFINKIEDMEPMIPIGDRMEGVLASYVDWLYKITEKRK